jgi:hypothetical protein
MIHATALPPPVEGQSWLNHPLDTSWHYPTATGIHMARIYEDADVVQLMRNDWDCYNDIKIDEWNTA